MDTSSKFSAAKLQEFAAEVDQIKSEIYSAIGEADFKHLKKIELWGRLSTLFAYSTAWIFPNPFSVFAFSLGQFTRWLLAHHILHRGYDRVPGIPKRYTSKGFAQGRRRFIDWFDWILPAAWDYEHNILHHYHTGEHHDPDLVERNAEFLRKAKLPKSIKYFFMAIFSISWKFTYYAPSTLGCMSAKNSNQKLKKEDVQPIYFKDIWKLHLPQIRTLWLRCYLPYSIFHFILIPALFLIISQQAALFVLINKLLAEAVTNFHSFLIIGPNHAGDDLHRYDFHYQGKPEFYLTQILSSVNYNCGTETKDYLQIWLNYQIEHHLFPDLPMLKYREVQPKIKALCEKYEIPYIQESVFTRFWKMINITVGNTNMRQGERKAIFG